MAEEWFVLKTKSKKECLVLKHLNEKGINYEFPLIQNIIETSKGIRKVKRPLITGYVFVKYQETKLEQLKYLPGSINFLKLEGKYQKLNQSDLNRLKALCNFDVEIIYTPEIGQKIEITTGILKGTQGIVSTRSNQNSIYIETGIKGIYVCIKTSTFSFKKIS